MNSDNSADLVCVLSDGGLVTYQTHTSDTGISFSPELYEDKLILPCQSKWKRKGCGHVFTVDTLRIATCQWVSVACWTNIYFYLFFQIFFGTFNDDDLGDIMCFPSGFNDSRSLAEGDAAATFLVSCPSGFNDSRSLVEGNTAATFLVNTKSGYNNSRFLAKGDATATFLVSFPSDSNDSRSLAERDAARNFLVSFPFGFTVSRFLAQGQQLCSWLVPSLDSIIPDP